MIDTIMIGSGLKSRLPIGNPGIWLDSGAGWAFFIPNPDYVVRGPSTAIGKHWESSEDLFLPERAWDAGRISGDEGIFRQRFS